MTLQKNQRLPAMFSVAAITMISLDNPVSANHGVGTGAWTHDDVDYHCMDSLDNLRTESGINPCEDFAAAVGVWNRIQLSNLVFDEVSSGEDMTVASADLDQMTWARNVLVVRGPVVHDSDIMFNTDHTWGNRATDWWKWWVKDYLSTAIHESGHSIVLRHDESSALMSSGHGIEEIYRTPSAHDIRSVQEKY